MTKNIWIGEALYLGCKIWSPIPGEPWYETKKEALAQSIRAVVEDPFDAWPKVRAVKYHRESEKRKYINKVWPILEL
jgi:hypothetical protein